MQKLFTTVKEEHTKPVQGIVKGDIPSWVTGSLYRNGPGMYEVGEDKFKHWFDPLAMFQRFHIENKKVTYQNRFLNSEMYKKDLAAQRIVVHAYGTAPLPDPCKNIFQRFLTYFQEIEHDNTLSGFFPLKDELYSATESNFIHRVDPETLETIERVDFSKYVAVNSGTGHAHYDADGTVHNIGNSYKGGPKTCIIKIPPRQKLADPFPDGEVMSAIKSSGKMSVNYMHSFGITENYYVYVEQPIFTNLFKVLTMKFRGTALNDAIQWWPGIQARFRVVNRKTGAEVNPDIVYEADPFMVFHHINAYEDDGHVVMDLCRHKDNTFINYLYLKNLTSEQCEANWRTFEEPEPCRYVIPLKVDKEASTGTNLVKLPRSTAKAELIKENTVHCTYETLAETGLEFPQVNYPRYNGVKYRYVYGVGWHNTGKHFHTLVKIDTHTRTYTEWSENNCYPSEPVFVPNPEGKSEDDGVLLAAVNSSDFDAGKSAFLIVFDAKTLTEIARAEFEDILRFPKDFHGMFRPTL